MPNKYQATPEEETCDKLLEEAKETLSGPALYIVEEIRKVAYEVWLIRNPPIDIEDIDLAKQSWRFSATKLTLKDFESLINIMRAAKAAEDSINPEDPTYIGYKIPRGYVHSYYNWIAGFLERSSLKSSKAMAIRSINSSGVRFSHRGRLGVSHR